MRLNVQAISGLSLLYWIVVILGVERAKAKIHRWHGKIKLPKAMAKQFSKFELCNSPSVSLSFETHPAF